MVSEMRALVVAGLVGIVACGPGLRVSAPRDAARLALSGDREDIEHLLRGSVVNGGLWFDDAGCAAQFATPGEVAEAQLPAFARCLAGLHLHASPREDALGDVIVMTDEPGFEIEARVVHEEFADPHLVWIGFASRRTDREDFPTISPQTLESLRLGGDRNGPLDPQTAAGLELDQVPQVHAAFTWVRLCVDETGAVSSARPYETTSEKASLAFTAAATSWKFRPFMRNGGTMPVCAMLRMTYPADQGPPVETLPLPPPPSRSRKEPIVFAEGAMQKLTEGKRIFGNTLITPDDRTKVYIQRKGIPRITGSFRVCIDDTGHVESALPLRSTGFANYDRALLANMLRWIYAPYRVNDQPVPVCTAITFIYTQN
jgi:hypothetical protein